MPQTFWMRLGERARKSLATPVLHSILVKNSNLKLHASGLPVAS